MGALLEKREAWLTKNLKIAGEPLTAHQARYIAGGRGATFHVVWRERDLDGDDINKPYQIWQSFNGAAVEWGDPFTDLDTASVVCAALNLLTKGDTSP